MLVNTRTVIGTIAYMGGVPAVLEEFCWAWSQMVQYNADYACGPKEQILYLRTKVSDHAFARSVLAASFQGDWLLMLDTDHQFEPDLAARLLREFEANDLDVLTGFYTYRQPPYAPVLFVKNPYGVLQNLGAWDKPEGDRPYLTPIDAAGGGCLLVRRRVFERIATELHEQPFAHRGAFSEDHSFFDRCRELGIQAYCCPSIESPHLTVRTVTLADYDTTDLPISERIPLTGEYPPWQP